MEHVWEQNTCTSDNIREVTVQFYFDLSEDGFLSHNPFNSMRKMMQEARKGLSFPLSHHASLPSDRHVKLHQGRFLCRHSVYDDTL